ncbi:MAG: UvrD-helicase domain-containing protein [Chloroflexota bacterium]|nr:UvrD-helicase domain-containing protein [Chloroflexota bacterium]
MPTILSLYQFTDQQSDAVQAPDRALVVTAGAGSGKTRTLVGRYLALLESDLPLRSIVAITFTDKAAREMRARIRAAIETWLEQCPGPVEGRCPEPVKGQCEDPAERARWEKAFAALDGARIGTIHSLCAEILRAHPAEAGVDPDFDVLDENQATLLKARATDTALAWATTDPQTVPIFGHLTEHQLRQTLVILVEKRLDATAAFDAGAGADHLARWSETLAAWLHQRLDHPAWTDPLSQLAHLQARQADDRLEIARREVLARQVETHAALEDHDWDALFIATLALRAAISTGGTKKNWDPDDLAAARGAMKALRTHFDAALAPLLKKKPISWALDERCADALPRLHRLFERTLAEYARLKDRRRALDFDDLEAKALALLIENDEVRSHWQSEVHAVLVDEFQDTNSRQQRLVYALSGFAKAQIPKPKSQTGDLFVVGDSKQSIYRFRGADVTVFRHVQADVTAAGGRHVPLDLTFRAHAPLVALVNDLLAPILGEGDDPERPYSVPFAPLTAHRKQPRPGGIRPPHVELHLGLGENASEGRAAAAAALARRLRRLHAEEKVEWGEMALLFRAATGFLPYEDALERAGIPFITVAGRGFYDRPEVRDLLNGLAALSDPTDDLALTGLLRSPAFALTDAALYLLRWRPKQQGDQEKGGQEDGFLTRSSCSLWKALHDPLDHLGSDDATRACRAREVITELHGLSGRTTVGNLLARLLDATHYRAALYLAGGHRPCRNVDKLLADAHCCGLVGVGEFLEYVQSLRDVAAREGEAPVEAGGAVQLMTIHKAKGLEFPIVVIADVAHAGHGHTPSVIISPDLGVLPGLREEKAHPVAYRLASLQETDQEEAESRRLLYVAATRAQEKLFLSGHIKAKRNGTPQLWGWLAWIGTEVGLDQAQLPNPLTAPQSLDLDWEGGPLTCMVYPAEGDKKTEGQGDKETTPPLRVSLSPPLPSLVAPLTFDSLADADPKIRERESEPPPRVWRVVPVAQRPEGPAWVVGALVHTALCHWRFPDQRGLEDFLLPYALSAGLTDPQEIHHTITGARRLLARFQAHPLYAELDVAERYHEVPYAVEVEDVPKNGIVDLLARSDGGWTLVEFKTDRLQSGADLEAHIRKKRYGEQVREYVAAVAHLLRVRPRALLVFLNVGGQVRVVTPDTT